MAHPGAESEIFHKERFDAIGLPQSAASRAAANAARRSRRSRPHPCDVEAVGAGAAAPPISLAVVGRPGAALAERVAAHAGLIEAVVARVACVSQLAARRHAQGDVEPGVGVPPRAPRVSVYRTAQPCRHSRAGPAPPRAGSTTAPGRDRCGRSSQPPSTSSIWRSRPSIWSISFCCCVIARTIAARRCSRVRRSRARCRSASVRAPGASDGGPHDREPPHL